MVRSIYWLGLCLCCTSFFSSLMTHDIFMVQESGCMADRLKTVALPTSCQLSQPCFMSQSPAAQKICSTWANKAIWVYLFIYFYFKFQPGAAPPYGQGGPRTNLTYKKKKITQNNLKFYIYLTLKNNLGTSWIFFYANKIKFWSTIWST